MFRITIAMITLAPVETLDLRPSHLEIGQTGSAPSSVPPDYRRTYVVDEVVSETRLLVRLRTVRTEEGRDQSVVTRSLPDFLFLLRMESTAGIPNPKAPPALSKAPSIPANRLGSTKAPLALPTAPRSVEPTTLRMEGLYQIVGFERIGVRSFYVLERVK